MRSPSCTFSVPSWMSACSERFPSNFSCERTRGMTRNVLCWCILAAVRTDEILVTVCWSPSPFCLNEMGQISGSRPFFCNSPCSPIHQIYGEIWCFWATIIWQTAAKFYHINQSKLLLFTLMATCPEVKCIKIHLMKVVSVVYICNRSRKLRRKNLRFLRNLWDTWGSFA